MPARKPDPEVSITPDTPDAIPMRKSVIPELYRFVRSLPADMPYADLAGAAQSAGWVWRMTEDGCHVAAPGLAMVRFRVEIGKATADMGLEYFDSITMMVPAEAPSPSLIARLNATVALTYMVFGRLPPQAAPVPQPERAAVSEIEEAPPVTKAPASAEEDIPWTKPVEKKPINVVDSRTPDGLPVLADLYDVEGSADDIVETALGIFENALELAQNQAALTALWNKNGAAIEFIKDFGSPDDKDRLAGMFKTRAKALSRRAA
jgi:hypothetical protein